MKQKINLQAKKEIELPARMFTEKDLSEMDIDSVKGKIFFNKIDKNNPFKKVTTKVKENMAVLNYRDYSQTKFSEKLLLENIKEQIASDECDFIIFPYFKDESDMDVKTKIQLAGNIKKNQNINKPIILEISHKCEIIHRELARLNHNFDFLSIFYGVYYGRYSTLTRISERILTFKAMTGKKVFCIGVPLKFEGEEITDCRFMPCFSIICDSWVKNWRQARPSKEIKLTDKEDLRSKTYESWIETHGTNQIIEPIKLTVRELFNPKNEKARKEYEKLLCDETFLEVESLEPQNIEKYISKKFANKYFVRVLTPYSEKIIQQMFRDNDIFEDYSLQERLILEHKIRENQFSPSFVEGSIKAIINKIRTEKNPPVMELVNTINDFKIA
jgi:hypothetical protein